MKRLRAKDLWDVRSRRSQPALVLQNNNKNHWQEECSNRRGDVAADEGNSQVLLDQCPDLSQEERHLCCGSDALSKSIRCSSVYHHDISLFDRVGGQRFEGGEDSNTAAAVNLDGVFSTSRVLRRCCAISIGSESKEK